MIAGIGSLHSNLQDKPFFQHFLQGVAARLQILGRSPDSWAKRYFTVERAICQDFVCRRLHSFSDIFGKHLYLRKPNVSSHSRNSSSNEYAVMSMVSGVTEM